MRRREIITVLGGAVVWPLVAQAQQPAMPVIGYLSSFPPDTRGKFIQAFRQGLNETGFVEGQNITIEYRWAEAGQYDRLPAMAVDLIGDHVAVLFASPINAASAAKGATSTTPIVFAIGSDPVKMRLVASLSHPGGNATGATFLSVELGKKRVELLRDLVPRMTTVALLVNPKNPTTMNQIEDMLEATRSLGLRFQAVNISAQSNLEGAFETIAQQHVDALVVGAEALFWGLRDQLAASAARHRLPTIYFAREFAIAGGLISYNSDFAIPFAKRGPM